MSARLHEAAALLQERAEGAITSLPDNTREWHSLDPLMQVGMTHGDALLIAIMSPPVALALADLLNEAARCIDYPETNSTDTDLAVAVADAILGATA